MIKIYKNLTKKELLLAAIAIVFIVAQVWLDLTMPEYMSDITRKIQTEGSTMNAILSSGGMMLLCAVGSLIAAVITSICSSRIATGFGATLRGKMFNKVQTFSLEEMGRFSTASLITRTTNDITQVQMLIVMGLQMLIKSPIMAVWTITKISTKQIEWTAATGVAIVMLFVLIIIAMLLVLPRFRRAQKLTDDLNRVTRENLTGLKVVRAYNAENYQENKFTGANTALRDNQLFTQHAMSFLMPSISLITSGLSLAIYWIGADLISNSLLSVRIEILSDMMVFVQYAMQLLMSFMMLVVIFMMYPRAQVSANRINEVLDTEAKIRDGSRTEGEPYIKGRVEFKNVSFRYADGEEPVLDNISFDVNRGETLAIIGATGSGKTSLINLIPRFYDVTKGEILVDGVNVKDYVQSALRDKIGYISQKAVLFSGTIRSNVAYGESDTISISDEDVHNAVEIAQSKDFVENLEDSYDGYVAQAGANLSGGQKQRISIARAVAKKPEIMIFDDSFSALDYKTDRTLRKTLDEKLSDTTRIIVAQRIGTIMEADRILVLDEGRIVGSGTHKELLNNCEVYKQIALSQLSEEELA